MGWTSLDGIDLADKRVLVRVDINVPMDDGRVTDATRIEKVAPTIADILSKGGRPILLAHFGRPKGHRVPEMSLKPLLPALQDAFGVPVRFAADCVGAEAQSAAGALPTGEVLLLENTRFHSGEEANASDFAAELAKNGDVYVNDAFSAAHRAHASTEGLARRLPSAAGRLMEQELKALAQALEDPERPLIAVVGGAKVSTKLDLLAHIVTRVDILVIGGGMANTFLAAQGHEIGKSLAERDMTETALEILDKAKTAGCRILLPADIVVARAFEAHADNQTVDASDCPPDAMILDAGPATVDEIKAAIDASKTLIWNGPLGAFEIEPFNAATVAAAQHAAARTDEGALVSVAGGGDTVAALNAAKAAERFTYVSTAGGAFLEWMEGKTLPGVAALQTD
ncbi:phosphoglycerate kinase [Aestuariibius insulae]|uniref:phosphoglycerate kinase n=1 Tax=Aestuariibius insulae TaxID=2058287 RepID=UPI00345EACDC